MAQFLRPNSIISAGAWTGSHTAIDEPSPPIDSDFIYSPNNPNNTVEVGLSSVTDPVSDATHVVRVRLARGDADGATPDAGGTATNYVIDLYQGATLIANLAATTAAPTAWTTLTFTLTSTQASAITNYADLRVRVTASGGGGSTANRRNVAVSWMEMEVPDAPLSVHALDQVAFRARNDDGTEVTATWKANTNTNWTQPSDENVRVRFEIQETGGVATAAQEWYRLQYRHNAGTWTDVNAASSVVRTTDSPNVGFENTTDQLNIGTGTFRDGEIDDDDGAASIGTAGWPANGHSEFEYCVQIRSADVVNGDTIELRVFENDPAQPLAAYSVIPVITVGIESTVVSGSFTADAEIAAGAVGPVNTLLVVNTPSTPHADDVAIKTRLESLGHIVTYRDQLSDASVAGDYDLIIISESVSSGNVTNKYKDTTTPVLAHEYAVWDDMALITIGGVATTTLQDQTDVVITDDGHPINDGIATGQQAIYSSVQSVAASVNGDTTRAVGSGAVRSAHILTSNSNWFLFTYDQGATLADSTAAPGKRAAFPIFTSTNGFQALNATGLALWDNTVNWLAPPPAGGAVAGSFTADAIISQVVNGSFTADAAISQIVSASFTADAIISQVASGSFTADAQITSAGTGAFTADATILRTETGAFTADAVISTIATGNFTADAILQSVASGSFTADGVIRATSTGSFSADATIADPPAGGGIAGLLIHESQVAGLPTSGTDFDAVKAIADSSWGSPNIADQNSLHSSRVLSGAVIYKVTGTASYKTKVDDALAALSGTEAAAFTNGVLAAARQLHAYVQAADLTGYRTSTFENWLLHMRDDNIGTHSRWQSIKGTTDNVASNWGFWALASRIAISAYLGDDADLAIAWSRFKSYFDGDYAFQTTADYDSRWSMDTYNSNNVLPRGVNLHGDGTDFRRGAPVEDAGRPEDRGGYPLADRTYTVDALQGLWHSMVLLMRLGYSAKTYSTNGIARVAEFNNREGEWNFWTSVRYVPTAINYTYDTSYTTTTDAEGRAFNSQLARYLGANNVFDPNPAAAPTTVFGSFTAEAYITNDIDWSGWSDTHGNFIEAPSDPTWGEWSDTYINQTPLTYEDRFTADAIISQAAFYSFTADAIISRTGAGSFAADSIISQINTGSFTADANIVAAEGNTFTADAIILAVSSGAFTASAVIERTLAASFTADAVITTAGTSSFTASAVIRAATIGAFTADATIAMVVSQSFVANAVIKRTESGSFTSNAILQRTVTGSFAADSIIRQTFANGFTADADIYHVVTGSFTANAEIYIIPDVSTNTFPANAVIRAPAAGSFTADAIILEKMGAAFTAQAVILNSAISGFTANANIAGSGAGQFTANAVIKETLGGSFTADAVITSALNAAFTAQAIILNVASNTFTANAHIKGQASGSYTADAVIRARTTDAFTADANIISTAVQSFTANANIQKIVDGSFVAQAVIRQTVSDGFTADAMVSIRTQSAFTANAVIEGITGGTFSAHAVIIHVYDGSFTADAVIGSASTTSFTADALIQRTFSASFTANAIISSAMVGGFTASAVIRERMFGNFTADAIVLKSSAGSFTANAIIQKTLASSFTASAVIETTAGADFTADAIISASHTNLFTADAIIETNVNGAFTVDAVIVNAVVHGFTADALIVVIEVKAGTFTADAVIGAYDPGYTGEIKRVRDTGERKKVTGSIERIRG